MPRIQNIDKAIDNLTRYIAINKQYIETLCIRKYRHNIKRTVSHPAIRNRLRPRRGGTTETAQIQKEKEKRI